MDKRKQRGLVLTPKGYEAIGVSPTAFVPLLDLPFYEDERTVTAVFDASGGFWGHEPRGCRDHRTVGPHRAWCFDCSEWCYPSAPCIRCEHPT